MRLADFIDQLVEIHNEHPFVDDDTEVMVDEKMLATGEISASNVEVRTWLDSARVVIW